MKEIYKITIETKYKNDFGLEVMRTCLSNVVSVLDRSKKGYHCKMEKVVEESGQ